MNEIGLKEKLAELGATEIQLKSKAVSLMADALTDEAVTASATARERMDELQKQVEQVSGDMDECLKIAEQAKREVEQANFSAAKIVRYMEQKEVLAKNSVIEDKAMKDALLFYRSMLEATRDVFGVDKMENDTICQAVETAGYGVWRSIMGGKFESEPAKKGKPHKIL